MPSKSSQSPPNQQHPPSSYYPPPDGFAHQSVGRPRGRSPGSTTGMGSGNMPAFRTARNVQPQPTDSNASTMHMYHGPMRNHPSTATQPPHQSMGQYGSNAPHQFFSGTAPLASDSHHEFVKESGQTSAHTRGHRQNTPGDARASYGMGGYANTVANAPLIPAIHSRDQRSGYGHTGRSTSDYATTSSVMPSHHPTSTPYHHSTYPNTASASNSSSTSRSRFGHPSASAGYSSELAIIDQQELRLSTNVPRDPTYLCECSGKGCGRCGGRGFCVSM